MRLLWQTVRQPDWSIKAYGLCYLISKLNAISLLTGEEVSDSQYKKFLNAMETLWHDPRYWKLHTAGTDHVLMWRKYNMYDNIEVSEIRLFSAQFWVNIFKKVPMVVSINVGDQFRQDRADWVLEYMDLSDTKKTGHATVIHWRYIKDSKRSNNIYSLTRAYLTNVKWLFKSQTVLVFKIK
jgi:hypothetical protein